MRVKQYIPCERGWVVVRRYRDDNDKIITENGNVVTGSYEIAAWAVIEIGENCIELVPCVQTDTVAAGPAPLVFGSISKPFWDYNICSPSQGWEYEFTEDETPPVGPDWEPFKLTESRVLWRRVVRF